MSQEDVERMQQADEQRERYRLYETARQELIAANSSSSQNYDRALLTLSSAFLGGSLAFIQSVTGKPIPATVGQWLLYAAWILVRVHHPLDLGVVRLLGLEYAEAH